MLYVYFTTRLLAWYFVMKEGESVSLGGFAFRQTTDPDIVDQSAKQLQC
jgi:hypothetical protein